MVKSKEGIEAKLSEMNNSMLSHFDKIYGKLENLGQEYHFINAGLKRVEGRVNGLDKKVEELIGKVDKIDNKLDEHMRQPAHT